MCLRLTPRAGQMRVLQDRHLGGLSWTLVWDLGHTTLTRVTSDPGLDTYPVWTPDGR